METNMSEQAAGPIGSSPPALAGRDGVIAPQGAAVGLSRVLWVCRALGGPGPGYLDDSWVRGRKRCFSVWMGFWWQLQSHSHPRLPINILSPELERLRDNLVFMRVWTLPDYQLSLIAWPCDPSGKQPRQHGGAVAPPDGAAATEPSCFTVGCKMGCSISPPAPPCTHQLTPKDQGFLQDPKSHRTQGLNANARSQLPGN